MNKISSKLFKKSFYFAFNKEDSFIIWRLWSTPIFINFLTWLDVKDFTEYLALILQRIPCDREGAISLLIVTSLFKELKQWWIDILDIGNWKYRCFELYRCSSILYAKIKNLISSSTVQINKICQNIDALYEKKTDLVLCTIEPF